MVAGHGEHRLDDSSQREGFSGFQTMVEKDNYKVQSINLLQKAGSARRLHRVGGGGPNRRLYPAGSGRHQEVRRSGRTRAVHAGSSAANRAQTDQRQQCAGGSVSKAGVSLPTRICSWMKAPRRQLLGGGPAAPVILHVRLAPHRERSHQHFHRLPAVPLARNQEHRQNHHHQTVLHIGRQLRHHQSSSLGRFASTRQRQARARSRWPSPALTTAASRTIPGRFVVVGNSGWASNQALGFSGNRNLLLNMVNWLSSDEDLISIRPKEPEDRRITLTRAQFRIGADHQPVLLAADRDLRRRDGLAQEEIAGVNDAVPWSVSRRCSVSRAWGSAFIFRTRRRPRKRPSRPRHASQDPRAHRSRHHQSRAKEEGRGRNGLSRDQRKMANYRA